MNLKTVFGPKMDPLASDDGPWGIVAEECCCGVSCGFELLGVGCPLTVGGRGGGGC